MAKDVLRAVERQGREQQAADARGQQGEFEVVVDGYRRRRPLTVQERREVEEQRLALRQRLYAAG